MVIFAPVEMIWALWHQNSGFHGDFSDGIWKIVVSFLSRGPCPYSTNEGWDKLLLDVRRTGCWSSDRPTPWILSKRAPAEAAQVSGQDTDALEHNWD